MNYLRPKNWQRFQHYRKRRPPWIKLYSTLLDDGDFLGLSAAAKAAAPLLWLVAAEDKQGFIPYDIPDLSMRLKLPAGELVLAIKSLIDKGFFFECAEDDRAELVAASTCPPTHQHQERGESEKDASNASKLEVSRTPSPNIWGPPWEQRLRGYKRGGFWPTMWGPRPEQAGCQVPHDLLDSWLKANGR